MIDRLLKLAGIETRSYLLRVPRAEENEGLLLLGDPGTGKSQIIHQLLAQIALRRPPEAVVCYDPAGEFIRHHFDAGKDMVLNPLDVRCPYWSPSAEVDYQKVSKGSTDRQLIAESFFPDREHSNSNSEFFIDSARKVFARMLEFRPDAQAVVEMLKDESAIDQILEETEHSNLTYQSAKGQRGGVLATLSEIGESLKLLPLAKECSRQITLTDWARKRKGWIFITSTPDTRDALRRLHTAWLNILMKRLLGDETGREHPCWVVVDEVHVLKRLPALSTALIEGRKYGLKMVLGTQNKAQFEEHYGRGAATMLSAPHVKILFRCNEPESARWVSDMIGEEEKERPRIGTTAAVQPNGRDSINYATFTERRLVVSREQIMGLKNLHGYWKYSDSVVPFRIEPQSRQMIAHAFIPRSNPAMVQEAPRHSDRPLPKQPRERVRKAVPCREVTQEMLDDIDLSF
jgi:type IV secretory pathway TraG/TraD family ATPase VirD4